MPRNLGALGHVIDAQARAIEDAGERQAALADHLG